VKQCHFDEPDELADLKSNWSGKQITVEYNRKKQKGGTINHDMNEGTKWGSWQDVEGNEQKKVKSGALRTHWGPKKESVHHA
jgi:hypothetical protein